MDKLPLSEDIRKALVRGEGRLAGFLRLVEHYEAGHWEEVSALATELGVDEGRLPECFMDAAAWADALASL